MAPHDLPDVGAIVTRLPGFGQRIERVGGGHGRRWWWAVIFLLGVSLVAPPLAAPARALGSGQKLLEKVQTHLFPPGHLFFCQLVNERPQGEKESFVLFMGFGGEGDRAGMVMVAPEEMKGHTALRLDSQLWRHVPGELEPRLEGLSGSLVNGVISNAELLPLDWNREYTVMAVGGELGNVRLELKARSEQAPYPRVAMIIDPTLVVPVRVDFFAAGGVMLKSAHYSDPKEFGPGLPPRPSRITYRNSMNPGYSSTLRIGSMDRRSLSSQVFTLEFLPRLGSVLK